MFPNFQKLQQFAAVSAPETPVSSVHARVKEIINGFPQASEHPEESLEEIISLKDQVEAFLQQAQQPVDTPEAQFVFDSIQRAIGLHFQACEMLLAAFEDDSPKLFPQIFKILKAGDELLAEAEKNADVYRSQAGITA